MLLVALTAPVLWIHLGYPDQSNDPPESTARQAYDLLAAGFGPARRKTPPLSTPSTACDPRFFLHCSNGLKPYTSAAP